MTRPPTSPGTPFLDRRLFLRGTAFAVGGASLASLVAACGGEVAETAGGGRILRMPFIADMQVPDPDIMYEGEGQQVMQACYEGLVQYAPESAEIVPGLAESWTVSDDQLTHTFKLRPDVTFTDGTPADADAWVKSFERRLAVNQGPAYMVYDTTASAPDPLTFVVTLAKPNNAFLHYLACPWQPWATSPTAVAANAVGGDLAQEWLKTHSAGTGPYMIKEFVAGTRYVLERNPDYWGGEVYFEEIRIEITPDIATQKLKLDGGEFDIITKGLAIADVRNYEKNPEFVVKVAYGGIGQALWLNMNAGIFADKALRQALIRAIDRKPAVDVAFGGLCEASEGMWIPNMYPTVDVPLPSEVDTETLTSMVAALPDNKMTLAWSQDSGAPIQQMADLIQTQLAPCGLDITVREMPSSEMFDLVSQPPEKRPDMLLAFLGGDALHLDTALRITLRSGAEPLNFFSYANPTLDALMDDAITKPSEEEMVAVYVEATELILDEAVWLPMCPTPYPVVARKGITGIELDGDYPQIFDPAKIKGA